MPAVSCSFATISVKQKSAFDECEDASGTIKFVGSTAELESIRLQSGLLRKTLCFAIYKHLLGFPMTPWTFRCMNDNGLNAAALK